MCESDRVNCETQGLARLMLKKPLMQICLMTSGPKMIFPV